MVSPRDVSGADSFSTLAVPSVGWPAKGKFLLRREDAHPHTFTFFCLGIATLNERGLRKLNSRAMACMRSVLSPTVSNTTASPLPLRAVSVKTSTI